MRSPAAGMPLRGNEEHFTDGDDEILESLVKTATKSSGARPAPRERKRTRHADRKSCKFLKFNLYSLSIVSFPYALIVQPTLLGVPLSNQSPSHPHRFIL